MAKFFRSMFYGLFLMFSVSGLYFLVPRCSGFLPNFLASGQEADENAGDRGNPHSDTADPAVFHSVKTDWGGVGLVEAQARGNRRLARAKSKVIELHYGDSLIFSKQYTYDLDPEITESESRFFGHPVNLYDFPGPVDVRAIHGQCSIVIIKSGKAIKAMILGFVFPKFDDSEFYMTEICEVDPTLILHSIGRKKTQSLVNKYKFPKEENVYAFALMEEWKGGIVFDGYGDRKIVDLTDIDNARNSDHFIRVR